MYTKKLLSASSLPVAVLGVLVALAISLVPACSSSAENQEENNAVNPMDTTPATTFEDPPPIDANAPREVQTATFATG